MHSHWGNALVRNKVKRGNSSVVEHNLAKVGVASSNLVSRSKLYFNPGGLAEWLCSGLQIRGSRFDSGTRLQFSRTSKVLHSITTLEIVPTEKPGW